MSSDRGCCLLVVGVVWCGIRHDGVSVLVDLYWYGISLLTKGWRLESPHAVGHSDFSDGHSEVGQSLPTHSLGSDKTTARTAPLLTPRTLLYPAVWQVTVDVCAEADHDYVAHSIFSLVLKLLQAMIAFTPAIVQALRTCQVGRYTYPHTGRDAWQPESCGVDWPLRPTLAASLARPRLHLSCLPVLVPDRPFRASSPPSGCWPATPPATTTTTWPSPGWSACSAAASSSRPTCVPRCSRPASCLTCSPPASGHR